MARKKTPETRICEWCGCVFETARSRQNCCCPGHYDLWQKEQRGKIARSNLIQNTGCLGSMGDPYADGRLRTDALFCPVL